MRSMMIGRSLFRSQFRPVHKALPGLYMLCEAQHHGKEDPGEVVLVGAWRVSDGPVLTAEPIVRHLGRSGYGSDAPGRFQRAYTVRLSQVRVSCPSAVHESTLWDTSIIPDLWSERAMNPSSRFQRVIP